MIFHENRLRNIMPDLLFLKKQYNLNCRLLQIIGGALRVNYESAFKKCVKRFETIRTDVPDLGPNCLQMLSAEGKSRHQQRKS